MANPPFEHHPEFQIPPERTPEATPAPSSVDLIRAGFDRLFNEMGDGVREQEPTVSPEVVTAAQILTIGDRVKAQRHAKISPDSERVA